MSRIGSQRIPIPSGVRVVLGDERVQVRGPRGALDSPVLPGIAVRRDDDALAVSLGRPDANRAYWGLTRALLANAVLGVTKGFTKELDIVGVGYRAQVKGRAVSFALGYSHPVEVPLPDGVDVEIQKNTHITVTGHDKQLVGQVAANMRALRKPDPYKQKGVRYTGERLIKKAGKTGA